MYDVMLLCNHGNYSAGEAFQGQVVPQISHVVDRDLKRFKVALYSNGDLVLTVPVTYVAWLTGPDSTGYNKHGFYKAQGVPAIDSHTVAVSYADLITYETVAAIYRTLTPHTKAIPSQAAKCIAARYMQNYAAPKELAILRAGNVDVSLPRLVIHLLGQYLEPMVEAVCQTGEA